MEERICLIEYPTHATRIHQVGTSVVCFKHNNNCCDFETFTVDNTEAIADYIVKPLPTSYWRVAVGEDCEE